MFSMIRPSRTPWRSSRRRRNPICASHRKHRRKLRTLWRLCGWGRPRRVALAAVAITSQTEAGSRTPAAVFASQRASPRRADAAARGPARSRTQRLAAQVRALAADRDRLAARIALLERNIDDMTGDNQKAGSGRTPAASTRRQKPPPPASQTHRPQHRPHGRRSMPSPTAAPIRRTKSDTPATERSRCRRPAPRLRRQRTGAGRRQPNRIRHRSRRRPDHRSVRQRWMAVKANFGPLLSGLHPLAARERRPAAPAIAWWSDRCRTARRPRVLRPLRRRPHRLPAGKFDGEQICAALIVARRTAAAY